MRMMAKVVLALSLVIACFAASLGHRGAGPAMAQPGASAQPPDTSGYGVGQALNGGVKVDAYKRKYPHNRKKKVVQVIRGTTSDTVPITSASLAANSDVAKAVRYVVSDSQCVSLAGNASAISCSVGVADAGASTRGASPAPGASASAAAPVITYDDVAAWAAYASATLSLPAHGPVIGPDPMKNEWKMLVVGLPVWVWTTDVQTASQSTTTNGITIDFQAIRSATTVNWGDGSSTTCTSMTPRPAGTPAMSKSPDCGHVYQKKSTYTITATSVWTVFWSALGFSGTVYVPRSASSQLVVGELHAVLTSRK